MKKLLLLFLILPFFLSAQIGIGDYEQFLKLPISTVGFLNQNGTVPLTANWPMGAFTLSQATWQGVAIAAGYGGTGFASYAAGDILHATGAITIGKLADVAVGQVLVSGGVGAVPAYSASPTLAGTLAANNLTASPTLSAEALTNVAGWTATGNWTYGAGAWSHATGSATALTATGKTAIAIGTKYEIVMTLTTSTAGGGVTVSLGGQTFAAVSTGAPTAHTFNVTALSTAALALTPTAGTWVGSLTISVKIVTQGQLNAEGIVLNSGQLLLPNGNSTNLAASFSKAPTFGYYYESSISGMYVGIPATALSRIFFSTNGTYLPTIVYIGGGGDVVFGRGGPATFQLGAAAATPVAQTFKGPDGLGSDKPSGGLSIIDGVGTGAGVPIGPKITSAYSLPAAATATTLQTAYIRQWAVGKTWSLTDAANTDIFSVTCTDGNGVGGYFIYTLTVYDDTRTQTESGTVLFGASNDVTETWTTNFSETSIQVLPSGTLATTWALDTATADTLKIKLLSDSSLTPTATYLRLQIFLNSPQTITLL